MSIELGIKITKCSYFLMLIFPFRLVKYFIFLTFCLFMIYMIKYSYQKFKEIQVRGCNIILPTPSIVDNSSQVNTVQLNVNAWNPRILTPRLFFFILLSIISSVSIYRLIKNAPISTVLIFATLLKPIILIFVAPLINFVNNPALRRFSVTHMKEIFHQNWNKLKIS